MMSCLTAMLERHQCLHQIPSGDKVTSAPVLLYKELVGGTKSPTRIKAPILSNTVEEPVLLRRGLRYGGRSRSFGGRSGSGKNYVC